MTVSRCAYTVLYTWDADSEAFIAIAPEVPGAIGQGDTRAEAEASIRESLESCLEFVLDQSQELPEPHTYEMGSVEVRLPLPRAAGM